MAEGERPDREVVVGPWSPRGGGPDGPTIEARLIRLEAAVEGLRHSQNLLTGATAAIGTILAAIVIGFGAYGLQRIDQTQQSIFHEAATTRQELVGVTNAIANSITAAREMRPPIIVVPSGSAPSPVAPSK
jgi:hypothetical protein